MTSNDSYFDYLFQANVFNLFRLFLPSNNSQIYSAKLFWFRRHAIPTFLQLWLQKKHLNCQFYKINSKAPQLHNLPPPNPFLSHINPQTLTISTQFSQRGNVQRSSNIRLHFNNSILVGRAKQSPNISVNSLQLTVFTHF